MDGKFAFSINARLRGRLEVASAVGKPEAGCCQKPGVSRAGGKHLNFLQGQFRANLKGCQPLAGDGAQRYPRISSPRNRTLKAVPETFKKLANAQPESPLPQLRLAAAGYAAKQVDAPIQALRKALAIRPDLLQAQRGIIAMHIAAGQTEEALKEAKAVQKARPKEAIGFAMEGDVLESQKRFADAARAYAEGAKHQPVAELVVKQIQLLHAGGLSADAHAVGTKWLQENPNDPTVRFHLATTAMQNKKFKEAVEGYKGVLKRQPDHLAALNNLAWVLGELKDPSAIGYAEKAYALAPKNAGVLDTNGWLLFNGGNVKRGIELLTQAATSAPREVEIRVHLAKALIHSGDKARAKTELEAAATVGDNARLKEEIDQLIRSL